MKHKIIYIILIAIIILSLIPISSCGIANTLTDDAGDLLLRDEEESPPEIILQSPTTEPMTASPFAYIPGGIKIGGKSIIEGVYFDGDNYNEYGDTGVLYTARPEMEEMGGPQTECNNDIFVGNVAWTMPGEWVQYTIDVKETGRYNIAAYLASDAYIAYSPDNIIEVSYDAISIGIAHYIESNGWQEYGLYPVGSVDMTEGVHIIKVEFLNGNINLAALEITPFDFQMETVPEPEPEPTIPQEQPIPPDPEATLRTVYIPGEIKLGGGTSIIEGVYFDSYNYTEYGIEGEYAYAVRHEMEEARGPQTEFGESGFAGNIGWTMPGEWVQYTIDVEEAGSYSFAAYLASGMDIAGNIEVSYDGMVIGRTNSQDTNGWQAYGLYPVGDAYMTEGIHIIKTEFFDGNTNLAAIEVTRLQ